MISRAILPLLRERLRQFPAAVLVGPRQSGKTTLARSFSGQYFDLEQEQDRLRLDILWGELLRSDALVILDEAQSWPAIFSKLRGAIDADRKRNGRFLLLGSVAPVLMREVSESLAGRIAIVELTPLTALELAPAALDKLWKFGGFPDGGVLDPDADTFPVWQNSFLSQMAQRDLPMWGLAAKPGVTERLMRLVAALNGTALNASQLGASLGVSYHTVNSYLDFLEGAFLIRRLRPFHARNFPKRLTKSPKIYWRDSGLLHALLEWSPAANILEQPWAGTSWESWMIEQVIAAHAFTGKPIQPYWFRTSDGLECDLLLENAGSREIIEIKLTSSPTLADFKKLDLIGRLVGAKRKILLSRIEDAHCLVSEDHWSVNLATYLKQIGAARQESTPPRHRTQAPGEPPPVPLLFSRLMESDAPLVKQGLLTEAALMQRAQWLHEDLDAVRFQDFEILPTREIADPATGLIFKLVEYQFGETDHDMEKAAPGFPKDSRLIDGTGLSRESLARFAQISAIGHTLIPHLWLGEKTLREHVRYPRQHLDTLNEVWWLSRWHGVDPASVVAEYAFPQSKGTKKKKPPTVDWRFQVLDGAVTINLEVKNRRGTVASKPMKKGVYLFGDEPENPFQPSVEDEINVLAITAYHAGHISQKEEADLVAGYLNESPAGEVLDAVALYVTGQGSYERLYFPKSRPLHKKDLILRSLHKPEDVEDHSRVGLQRFPRPLEEVFAEFQAEEP